MDITWTQFLIICPLVFLAGFVDAVVGGGGLISLPAYFMGGLPVHYVLGTNKMSSCMGTALTTWKFARRGWIEWRPAAGGVLCALCGSSLGAHIALYLDPAYFKLIILVVLPLTAAYVMTKKSIDTDKPPYGLRRPRPSPWAAPSSWGCTTDSTGPARAPFSCSSSRASRTCASPRRTAWPKRSTSPQTARPSRSSS